LLDVIVALKRQHDAIEVIRIGSADAPPFGASDSDILVFSEAQRYVLVTDNRATMPVHFTDHPAAGRHHWGVVVLSRELPVGQLAVEVYLFWEASEAEEWIDHVEWIPY